MQWAVGVTTVDQRLNDLLPQTLESLRSGGFGSMRLFVDGPKDSAPYHKFGLPTTFRVPRVLAWPNWFMSLQELYLRQPKADLYAIFQDDILCVKGLRELIETTMPPKTYLNLYTREENQKIADTRGWKGWFKASQNGFGALGLVFDSESVRELLASRDSLNKILTNDKPNHNIDGLVSHVLSGKRQEWCHNPSLLQHMGKVSAIGNRGQSEATSFIEDGKMPPVRKIIKSPPQATPIKEEIPSQPTVQDSAPKMTRPIFTGDPTIDLPGEWHLLEKNGRVSRIFTLDSSSMTCQKSSAFRVNGKHVSSPQSVGGTWIIFNGVARMTWQDGTMDSLALIDGGGMSLSFIQNWERTPINSQKAIKTR